MAERVVGARADYVRGVYLKGDLIFQGEAKSKELKKLLTNLGFEVSVADVKGYETDSPFYKFPLKFKDVKKVKGKCFSRAQKSNDGMVLHCDFPRGHAGSHMDLSGKYGISWTKGDFES